MIMEQIFQFCSAQCLKPEGFQMQEVQAKSSSIASPRLRKPCVILGAKHCAELSPAVLSRLASRESFRIIRCTVLTTALPSDRNSEKLFGPKKPTQIDPWSI